MVILFKDRHAELAEIKRLLETNKFEFLIMYGRRRIGKTELILNATQKKRRIYYLAIRRNNLERLYEQCISSFPEAGKLKMDWEIIFDFLKDKVDAVIIDEFQNLISEDRDILNVFQAIIDNKLANSKIKLAVLGSSVSIMTSRILSYQSPLYGRRTCTLKLGKVEFQDFWEFFPKLQAEKLVEIYGFCGGIPYYAVRIEGDFWKWLENEITSKTTFLRDEIDFIMRYEFSDVSTYKVILEAIANGKTVINEIKDFAKLSRTDISPYLKNLIDVGFVKRIVPITENQKSRFGKYYLADNFLKFWFRYFYPNLSSIELGVYSTAQIKKDYNAYLGKIFEEICTAYISKQSKKYTKIGAWWHKEHEIDIVALNDDSKEILFCECKWQDKVDAGKVLDGLKVKAKLVDWNVSDRKERFAVFAKSFKRKFKEKNVRLYDLKDFRNSSQAYSIMKK